jgi:hypothetical protein
MVAGHRSRRDRAGGLPIDLRGSDQTYHAGAHGRRPRQVRAAPFECSAPVLAECVGIIVDVSSDRTTVVERSLSHGDVMPENVTSADLWDVLVPPLDRVAPSRQVVVDLALIADIKVRHDAGRQLFVRHNQCCNFSKHSCDHCEGFPYLSESLLFSTMTRFGLNGGGTGGPACRSIGFPDQSKFPVRT